MWRRTFIRFTLVVLVVAAGLLVFAASHKPMVPKTCKEAQDDCCDNNKAQGDFNIWESISRTLNTNVQY